VSSASPAIDPVVDAADAALHPWVKRHFSAEARKQALARELHFWLVTAATDMSWAENFRAHVPDVGEPARSYLARWVPLGGDAGGHVLVGPRYLGLDPSWPFVGVAASDRPLVPDDAEAPTGIARRMFAAFAPRFVMVHTSDPVDAWPGTTPERRLVAGTLEQLRNRPPAGCVRAEARRDTGFYGEYLRMHEAHVACEPSHARHARCETREDLDKLARAGLLFDVLVDGAWAGLIAAEPDVASGMTGARVIELILDHPYRGRGYGPSLTTLLARKLDLPGDQALFGTIHHQNTAAYRSALAAGRVDVGGEIVIPL
jgi:hypothetical protein